MSDRKKGNVPSKRPPHRDSDLLQPPSNNRYPGGDENPYAGPPSGNLYHGVDQHGFSLPENSSQPYAAESHLQGHTTRSRPQSFGTGRHLHPYGTQPRPQQDPLERPPPRRPTDRDRLYDEPAEREDSAVTMINQNTGSRRSRPDNERRYDSTTENEQSALTVRGPTTVATRPPTDIVRRSDKLNSGKARKSRNTAEAPAPGVKISGGGGNINMSYVGNFAANIKNDARIFDVTLRHQDDKSKGHHSEGRTIESSNDNRTTGRNRTQAIESSRDDQNMGRSRTKAIEPSRGSRSTQPTGAQVRDYYAILGCTIDDNAVDITRKGMSKQSELIERATRRMSKKELQKHEAKIDLVNEAFDVLDSEKTRLEYNKEWRSLYGKKGSSQQQRT